MGFCPCSLAGMVEAASGCLTERAPMDGAARAARVVRANLLLFRGPPRVVVGLGDGHHPVPHALLQAGHVVPGSVVPHRYPPNSVPRVGYDALPT